MIEIINQTAIEAELEELRQRACRCCANAGGNECRYCGLDDSRTVFWAEGGMGGKKKYCKSKNSRSDEP